MYKKITKQKTDSLVQRLSALSVFPINDSARVQLSLLCLSSLDCDTILIINAGDTHHNQARFNCGYKSRSLATRT